MSNGSVIRALGVFAAGLALAGMVSSCATSPPETAVATPAPAAQRHVPSLTDGWTPAPLHYNIQHPYDLKTEERYEYDAANGVHHFWVYFKDKPHAPPPNKTNARTEMRVESFINGQRMFDGDVNVSPGTYACIAQIFDEAHGPVTMVIARPDGTVTIGRTVIATNVIGRWCNLKMTTETREGGKINVYWDDALAGTYNSRGPRAYYFKCGVYARTDSDRSEVRYRNIKIWSKAE